MPSRALIQAADGDIQGTTSESGTTVGGATTRYLTVAMASGALTSKVPFNGQNENISDTEPVPRWAEIPPPETKARLMSSKMEHRPAAIGEASVLASDFRRASKKHAAVDIVVRTQDHALRSESIWAFVLAFKIVEVG